MSNRRPVVYLAIIAAAALLNFIYDNYLPQPSESAAKNPAVENTTAETPEAPAAKATASEPAAPDQTASVPANVYRTGWPELPAERADDDRYYTRHLFGAEEGAAENVRNYSSCYSRRHRCPVWVAAPLHPSYRDEARRSDRFRFDPTLPVDIQPLLRSSYGDYTRGHLLGSAERTVSGEANAQTFYASNIAPQLGRGFNAANGAWNNLEIFVDRQVCADTLYVVTGCLFDDYTDAGGRRVEASATLNKNDGAEVAVPTAYYKVLLRTRAGDTGRRVADCKSSELKCAAFVVGHYDAKGRKPSAADMMSVAEIERITGETFFAGVPAAPKLSADPRDWGL